MEEEWRVLGGVGVGQACEARGAHALVGQQHKDV